jgi:hypothetical protein
MAVVAADRRVGVAVLEELVLVDELVWMGVGRRPVVNPCIWAGVPMASNARPL